MSARTCYVGFSNAAWKQTFPGELTRLDQTHPKKAPSSWSLSLIIAIKWYLAHGQKHLMLQIRFSKNVWTLLSATHSDFRWNLEQAEMTSTTVPLLPWQFPIASSHCGPLSPQIGQVVSDLAAYFGRDILVSFDQNRSYFNLSPSQERPFRHGPQRGKEHKRTTIDRSGP